MTTTPPPPSTATSSTPTSLLIHLLEPWLERARQCIRINLDEFTEPSDVGDDLWIQWNLSAPRSPDISATLDVEALELLDLLVRVDYREGWRQILMLNSLEVHLSALDALLPTRTYPRFMLVWDGDGDDDEEDGMAPLVESFLFEPPSENHTATHVTTRDALLQCWAERHGADAFSREPADRIPLCVEFNLDSARYIDTAHSWMNDLANTMACVKDPARRQLFQNAAWHLQPSLPAVPSQIYQLKRVHITGSSIDFADYDLHRIQAITQCGVPVTSLSISACDHNVGQLTPLGTTAFFRYMFIDQPRARMPTAIVLQPFVGPSVFQGMCSALLENHTVDDVFFFLPQGLELPRQWDLRRFWPWIAYSVFSREANASLQFLELDVASFNDAQFHAFARVLQARDPLAAIAMTPSTQMSFNHKFDETRLEREPVVVDIRPHATLHIRNMGSDGELTLLSSGDRIQTLRWVHDFNEAGYVCVVYPGAGLAWVHRDEILDRRAFCPPVDRPVHTFARIGFHLSNTTSLSAVLSLLRLIGPRTRILTFSSTGSVLLDDAFLRSALEACPLVDRLDLAQLRIASLSWLSDGHRLVSLSLASVKCEDMESYSRLMIQLRSEEQDHHRYRDVPLRKSLKELSIHLEETQLVALWTRIIAMLNANRCLERLVVSVASPEHDDEPDNDGSTRITPNRVEQLLAHNGDQLHVQHKPVPLRSKLAFLSAFHSPRNHAAEPALPEMDAALIGIIFKLAAPNKTRVCGFVGR